MRGLLAGLLGGALVLAGSGCGAAKEKPVPVEGIVRLDGQPLAGASVLFSPVEGGLPASAVTQDDGAFQLACSKGEGAFPGDYKVVITLPEPLAPAEEGLSAQEHAQRQLKGMIGQSKKKAQSKRRSARQQSPIPAQFTKVTTTPLRQTVPPAEGKVVLELRSK